MYRKCTKCGIEAHSVEEAKELKFTPDKSSKFGYRNRCYPCFKTDNSSKAMRDWKTKHQVFKRYGCSVAEYKQRMLTSDCCEVCGKKDNLCYDHDHKTMEFRGVLCRGCNRSIGQLGDTRKDIDKVMNYLDKHNKEEYTPMKYLYNFNEKLRKHFCNDSAKQKQQCVPCLKAIQAHIKQYLGDK
mgnify:FL=1